MIQETRKIHKIIFQIRISWKVILLIVSMNSVDGFAQSSAPSPVTEYRAGVDYKLKLRFQKLWTNYAIFYDDRNELFYLKYRRDKWDYSNNNKVLDLAESLEYVVSFKYLGSAPDELFATPDLQNQSPSTSSRKIRSQKNIQLGEYKGHTDFQIEMIRY